MRPAIDVEQFLEQCVLLLDDEAAQTSTPVDLVDVLLSKMDLSTAVIEEAKTILVTHDTGIFLNVLNYNSLMGSNKLMIIIFYFKFLPWLRQFKQHTAQETMPTVTPLIMMSLGCAQCEFNLSSH